MSYIDSTLLKNEVVLFRTKPHWIIFGKSVFWFVLAILLFMFGDNLNINSMHFNPSVPMYVIVANIALLFGVISAIAAFINYQTSEYGITNKRILMKIGFIRRMSLEIFLQKIEGVKVNQSVLGRLLRYGSIIIIGVGGSKDPFDKIPEPLEFRRRVQEQIENFVNNPTQKSD